MYYSAFLLGFLGSLHCFGMCGPLSLLLPSNVSNKTEYFIGRIIYNFGRIMTYIILGLFIGFVGERIGFYIPQKIVFFTIGTFLLAYSIMPSKIKNLISLSKPVSKMNSFVKTQIKNLNYKNKYLSNFSFGLINGLIPCGLVYAALSGAFLRSNSLESAIYMAVFGLGTLPMMLSFGLIGSILFNKIKLNPTTVFTVSYFILGVFLLYKSYKTPIQHYSNQNEITICNGT